MHRTQAEGAVLNAEGKLVHTNGDPQGDPIVPPSIDDAEDMNAHQEEIAKCIEDQGVALKTKATDTPPYTQLANAVGQKRVTFKVASTIVTTVESKGLTVTRLSTGVYSITIGNDYANLGYDIQLTIGVTGGTLATGYRVAFSNKALGSFRVHVLNDAGSGSEYADMEVCVRTSGTLATS